MTKPRKEQVRNLKTNYTTVLSENIQTNFSQFNMKGMRNETAGTYAYNDFMANVPTGISTGADQDCPAFIWQMSDQFYGNFPLSVGDSFTIQMSSLNSGSPMSVEIEAGDITTVSGSPVVTTFALIDRINATLASYGAAANGAGSYLGRLWIKSVGVSGVAVGSDQNLTIQETTAGILSVLGISTSESISVNGRDKSTRGLVTSSPDGFGGYAECRDPITGEKSYGTNLYLVRDITKPGAQYMKPFTDQHPIFARVWYNPGPVNDGRSIDLTFWARYPGNAEFLFRRPNISALNGTDSITITFKDAPAFGSTISTWTTTFASVAGISMLDVVGQINSAWASSLAGGALDNDPTVACVRFARGPFSFAHDCTLSFSRPGTSGAVVSFSAGEVLTETQVQERIQSVIDANPLISYLSCTYNSTKGVELFSTSNNGLEIKPTTAGDTEAWSVFGIQSGVYRGISVATLYGSDAILIRCPIENSQITITCSAGTAAKLGIPTSSSVSSINEDKPVFISPEVDLSIPESIEFWEVPDNIESQNRQFFSENNVPDSYAENRWMNALGVSPLIGSDLKILTQFLPKHYPVLSVEQLRVVSSNASGSLSYDTPKIVSMHGTAFTNYDLLIQSTPSDGFSSGSYGAMRIFTNSTGIVITNNAKRINSTNSWISDVDGPTSSFAWVISEDTVWCKKHSVNTSVSWTDSSWDESAFNIASSINIQGIVEVSGTLNFPNTYPDSPDLDIPQITIQRLNKGNNPTGNQKYTLIMESPTSGVGAALPVRIYMSNSLTNTFNEASINGFMFTVNARWSQSTGQWSRDVTTESATAWVMTKGLTTNPGVSNTRKAGFGMMTSNTNSWSDTAWVKTGYYSYTRDDLNGVTSGMTLYGKSTIDVGPGLNYLSADNIVRSWGKIAYANPPVLVNDGGVPATQIQYNIASASRVSTGIYQVNYTTNVGTANCVLVSNISGNTTVNFSVDTHSTSNFRMAKTVAGSLADTSYAGSHITLGNTTSGAFFPS